jgi:hypothetical protein
MPPGLSKEGVPHRFWKKHGTPILTIVVFIHGPDTKIISIITENWSVVSTPLKNISQMGLSFPIYGKI